MTEREYLYVSALRYAAMARTILGDAIGDLRIIERAEVPLMVHAYEVIDGVVDGPYDELELATADR